MMRSPRARAADAARPAKLAISLLIAALNPSCGAGDAKSLEGAVDQVESAVDVTRPIAVRLISIAGPNCAGMTQAEANQAIADINLASAPNGLKFRLHRLDVLPLGKDTKNTPATWSDLAPLWESMGVSTGAAAPLIARVDAVPQTLSRWLSNYRRAVMPEEVVAFRACGGGVEMVDGAFFPQGDFVHEMGHGLGLPHSYLVAPTCQNYDLIYAARGRGKPNVYFESEQACLDFERDQITSPFGGPYTFFRMDARNEQPAGNVRDFSGVPSVQHVRCATCGTKADGSKLTFADPLTDGIERHVIGEPQIKGYLDFVEGVPSINAMTYCSTTGCPSKRHYSASQRAAMQAYALDPAKSWMFSWGTPAAPNPIPNDGPIIAAGQGLRLNQSMFSANRRFMLSLEGNGILALYMRDVAGRYSVPLWKSGFLAQGEETTTDTTDLTLLMQSDGNLVAYNLSYQSLWVTRTRTRGSVTRLTDDGDLQVVSGGTVLWHTATGGH